MHSPALRIALLLAMAFAASIAATWAKSHLAAAGQTQRTHLLSGPVASARAG